METILKYPPVESCQDVVDILSDQTGKDYRIYQGFGRDDDEIKTIATGMFILESHILFVYLLSCFYFPLTKINKKYMIILTETSSTYNII